ncbi:hypothetical protein M427DRAFT_51898 [Gonapodya prolifera JEL478]|uniref:Acyltransferase C-terminal domain-containing protein n=1 Tax=Gonapodya prolifera (strain JEL478) TaxID=1344416 RepID=A0A139AW34_GONPJ|nr:hypothetical protein M427DRAFT_51898 [Gonapodya prolifera JEL478]|eukprot:KXS20946.1 hypothetical protein M427DRAFT_51898 [Gonapodya prolifera JEL478]
MASLPIYGWGMRMFEFIFVKFGRSAPATSFLDALLRNTSPSLPLTLILFPEGTLLYGSNQEKSVEYLRRELKLPSDAEVPYPYRNVLLPKSAGLHASFAALPNPPTQLWDFTIGYVGCRKPGTPAAGGAYPFDAIGPGAFHNGRQKVRRLAIHLRRWSADEIPGIAEGDEEASAEPTSSRTPSPSPSSASSATSPTSGAPAPPASFTSWLRDRFLEKDALMDSFYDTGHFPKVDPFIKNGEVEERSRLELPNETKMIMKLQPRTLWDVVWVLLMPVAIPVDFLINWIGGKWKDEKWGVQGRVKVE